MVQYIKATDVAKMARKELKEAFPGQKFSVRVSSGRALEIGWVDGPPTAAVKELTGKYAGESFDGMTDMRSDRDNGATEAGEKISYLTSFVFARRELSPEVEEALKAELAAEIAAETGRSVEDILDFHGFLPTPQTIARECGRWIEASLYGYTTMLAEARAAK